MHAHGNRPLFEGLPKRSCTSQPIGAICATDGVEQPACLVSWKRTTSAPFPAGRCSARKATHCIKPTAVYLPPKREGSGNKFNVVIWLHGFYVRNHKFLFRNDPARLREQVRNSNKDVVLIAPFLGFEYAVGKSFAGNYSVDDLAHGKMGRTLFG